jgi:hypothetical protein
MTHHARLNLIMLLTIMGLMVFIYLKPHSQDVQEYSISSASVDAAQDLRIIRQQEEIFLKHLDNRWHLIKPVQIRADEKKVREILQILAATSNQYFPLVDLGRFGLDRPDVQMYINDEYFGFGGFSPTTHQQYVATNDQVYLLSLRYMLALPPSASELIDKQLLGPGEIPVKFELKHFTIESQNGSWHITRQDSDQILDEKTMKHWLELWQTVHAEKITLERASGLDSGGNFIEISLHDGQALNLKVLSNEIELLLLRADNGVGYHFSADVGRQLLDPFTIN